MPEFLERHPGLLYVIATLIPLASFLLLLLAGLLRNFGRRSPEGSLGHNLYRVMGGETPGRGAAYVATAAIFLAFVCSLTGFIWHLQDSHHIAEEAPQLRKKIARLVHERDHAETDKQAEDLGKQANTLQKELAELEGRWAGSIAWASVHPRGVSDPGQASQLRVGYKIDNLATLMFLMVTFIATLIHLFSIGYMTDETRAVVEDHEVHVGHHHLHRRGRFGRFFMFLSLFCFSMLNLILADNLFQVFVSWELVGVCSYLLVGFYYERHSAANAANKAFITNRVGDAGFIIGLLILWTYVGTFNFEKIFQRVRSPETAMNPATHKPDTPAWAHQIVRAEITTDRKGANPMLYPLPAEGAVGLNGYAVLFPRDQSDSHFMALGPKGRKTARYHASPAADEYSAMPYWLLVVAGLGIFLGCVGKSAQFPLQVWLPDAMAGPTPVSALIHAATMVAAGVYLVGRTYPLFTPEVLLVIAYTGAITLFVAATVALVMTDIKKVLAYSTVSQLGYMMLGLGVGGWVAGLFHLITHAFFKALLFLGSGSVIYGCHHQQEMTKMGGLYPKLKITALTMLVGCLTIAGTPLFSGWYSKDSIIAAAFGYGYVNPQHVLLFILPLLTAGITTFYMFRMWFMTFTGKPRDHHVYDHAHESPWVMTLPLVVLAFFSIVVAWGWPIWDAEASALEAHIHHAQPHSVIADFGGVAGLDFWSGPALPSEERALAFARGAAHHFHGLAGYLALALTGLGFIFAYLVYYRRVFDPAEAREQFPGVYAFLWNKWYFDELYSALLVRPALVVASWCRRFDNKVIDGAVDGSAVATVRVARDSGWFDLRIVDGLVNVLAAAFYGFGSLLRSVQTGYLRSYVVFLVVAAVGIWVVLSAWFGAPAAPPPPPPLP